METNAELYEQDLSRWGKQTAAFFREGKIAEVDLVAVAEKLESLGVSDAHRLWNQLRKLLVWFLAWNYAPTQRVKHPHWYVRVVKTLAVTSR